MPYYGPVIIAPLTSHATARSGRGGTSFESQAANRSAPDMRAKPCRTSERYDLSRNACIDLSIRRILARGAAKIDD
jgi:hypothetical protein